MTYQIDVISVRPDNNVEWITRFTANTRKGCRRKATNWLNVNYFFLSDITKRTNEFTDSIEEWVLR